MRNPGSPEFLSCQAIAKRTDAVHVRDSVGTEPSLFILKEARAPLSVTLCS